MSVPQCAVILVAAIFSLSCGREDNTPTQRVPPPSDESYSQVASIVADNCGVCHNGNIHPRRINSAASFRGAEITRRIDTGNMPPSPRRVAPGDKQKLLTYLRR